MSVQNQVVGNLREGIGLIVGNRLLSAVHHTGLQCRIQLAESHNRRRSAQALNHTIHDRVIGHTQLHTGQILQTVHRILGKEMAEALLTIEQASHTRAVVMRLKQEFRSQIRGREIPEMIPVHKGVGNGQQHGLLAAVAGQCKCRDTGHINRSASAKHGIQYVILRAKNTGGLQIDRDRTAG